MRKVLLVTMAVVMLLTGCGNSIPEGFTKESYKLSKKALEIMDDYNSGNLSRDYTKEELESLADRVDDLREKYEKDGKRDEASNLLGVAIYIRGFNWALISKTGNTYEEADKLRELLN